MRPKRQKERDAAADAREQAHYDYLEARLDNAPEAPKLEPWQAGTAPESTPFKTTPFDPSSVTKPGESSDSSDSSPSAPDPSGPLNFQSVKAMAEKSGAKFPGLVAAQWQLESGGGSSELASKHNNLFGQKGEGVNYNTQEDGAGGMTTINDSFMQFDSKQGSVDYLVNRWYKDYKGYKGVNNAGSITEAAEMLKGEGYATDRNYVSKLTRILREQGEL